MQPRHLAQHDLQCRYAGCSNRARVYLSRGKGVPKAFGVPKGWLVQGKVEGSTYLIVAVCKHHATLERSKSAWNNWDETEVQRELDSAKA